MTSFFSKEETKLIKGVALVMMFLLHLFCFPEWWPEGVSYSWAINYSYIVMEPLRGCVAIYAFVTGYTYFYCKKKDIVYSAGKIIDVYIPYWLCYAFLILIAVVTSTYRYTIIEVFKELMGVGRNTMFFCWYILLYVYVMVLLPLLSKLFAKRKPFLELMIVLVLIPNGLGKFNSFLGEFIPNNFLGEPISYLVKWLHIVLIGYMCAQYDAFGEVDTRFDKYFNNRVTKATFISTILIISFLARHSFPYMQLSFGKLPFFEYELKFAISLDFIYTPVFIYSVLKLFRLVKVSIVTRCLQFLGKYSLLCWFLSSLFFNVSKDIFGPILYAPKRPLPVLLWGLALCLVPAVVFDVIVEKIRGKRKRIFAKISDI